MLLREAGRKEINWRRRISSMKRRMWSRGEQEVQEEEEEIEEQHSLG